MNEITLDVKIAKTTIDRNIYGHFSEHLGRCIYEGFWVGEDSPIPNVRGIRSDVVAALRKIKAPVLRWPGGCFADEYHWMDGIGPRERRPTMVNTHWGGVVENNHFGTHEFMDLCDQLDCEPYICGNVGSGTVQEMSQWVEYVTFDGKSPMADLRRANGRHEPWRLKYFGVGNENWGCGGRMTPEYYADLYRRYALYARDYGDNKLYRIACGASGDDYHWTEVLMAKAGDTRTPRGCQMDGLALHYYTSVKRLPDGSREGSATVFDEAGWIEIVSKALFMDELVCKHGTIMDKYDPDKKVAMIVDEWGTWYAVEPGTHPRFLYQQNTMRDAIAAAVTLDIFNKHADRVRMANIAQTVNVLQALVLTQQEKMLLTPTYHVFDLYTAHQDATLVPVDIQSERYQHAGYSVPAISASASVNDEGKLHLTASNANPHKDIAVSVFIRGLKGRTVEGQALHAAAMNAHNTFEQPDVVKPQPFNGARLTAEGMEFVIPKMSVIALDIM
ncbi:MAG: intracellular exo-alpha-L-arabinofuranosidase 2 [Chloroflexota bacterium]|nr:alpha-N-arabinofuranosidase [Caldilinea sp.]GIK72450.1 MAG: intracellular exo-alpha-L-arabinofuranosidase 2 [Chloroflexota bacterium]